MKTIRYIDLFAGIGAFHQAFNNFKSQCVLAVEINKKAQEIYMINNGLKPCNDVNEIPIEVYPYHDILCAGFPCQSFTQSGYRLGLKDSRGELFYKITAIASYHRPKVILLENVPNLTLHDQGKTFKTIKDKLKHCGYKVFSKVLNSSDFGVPQARRRLYFICFRKDLKVKDFEFSYWRSPTKLIDYCSDKFITSRLILKKRKDIIFYKDVDITPSQNPIKLGYYGNGRQSQRLYHSNGHSVTLVAGGRESNGNYLINSDFRILHPRECARLMGFSDSFILPLHFPTAYYLLGNSIVVNVLNSIIDSVINYL